MNTSLDCMPCFINQTLKAVRMISDDPEVHQRIVSSVLKKAADFDLSSPPPQMAQYIHGLIREISGIDDPYKPEKQRYNKFMLDFLPKMRELITNADDPFDTALRLSIAGNIIDFGVHSSLEEDYVMDTFRNTLADEFAFDQHKLLQNEIEKAQLILYLGDNAGEIVCDRLFIETQFPLQKTVFAVRGEPIINDVTVEDAKVAGLTELVQVIDNGAAAPGTLLAECSDEFLDIYNRADLVISKGQGNYESLSAENKNIFFLLKVKCGIVSSDLGVPLGSTVVFKQELLIDQTV